MELELIAIIREKGKKDVKIGIAMDLKEGKEEKGMISLIHSLINTILLKFNPLIPYSDFLKLINGDVETTEKYIFYPGSEQYKIKQVREIIIK